MAVPAAPAAWPPGSGEMARLIREHDWATTSLGPVARWSERLKGVVELMLASPQVASLAVGPERVLLYNDAAARLYQGRHPDVLGRPLAEAFPESYPSVAPLYDRAFAGEVVEVPARPVAVSEAGGEVFEATLLPVCDETGTVMAVQMTGQEVSAQTKAAAILHESEARQAFLLRFSDALRAEPDVDAVATCAIGMLAEHMGLDRCYITFYRPEDDEAVFPYQVGNDTVPPLPPKVRLSDFPDAYEQVRHGTFVIEDDFERRGLSDAERESSKGLGMRAMLASTIRRGEGNPLASMMAVSSRPRRWTPGEIALVEETAERTWAAMERARTEAALRDSEARYHALFAATDEGFGVIEVVRDETGRPANFRHLRMNHALEGLIGLQPEVVLGRLISDFLPREQADWWITFYGEVLTSGLPRHVEQFAPTLDRWLKVSAIPFGPDQVAVIFEDITERKRSEVALRESEERLRAFGEASSGALWVRDAASWAFEYVSPAVEAIYGVSPEAVLADAELLHSLIAPEEQERVSRNVARVGAGEVVVQEYRIRRPNGGGVRWVRSTGFPLRDDDGQVRRTGAIVQDITEQKLAEQALAESEERFRAIVETAQDYAIFTTDPEGGIVEWPPGAQAVFGWSPEEAVGQPVDITFTPEDREKGEPEKERREARETGQAPNVRWHVCKDGSRVFIDGMTRPLRGSEGTLTGFLKVGQDVTEQRAMQDRLKVLVAELQHRTRNLMGVVQAMSRKTMAGATSLEDFEARFHDRMGALARVNSLLSRLSEGDRITFDEIIRTELTAHGALDRDGWRPQVRLDGPDGVRLKSSTVQTLALALHELATNAVKYGALAQHDGRLAVTWRRLEESATPGAQPQLIVEWRESGVAMPDADASPQGGGYGRELIEQALPYQLGADTTYAMTPDGVHCTIILPLSSTEGGAGPATGGDHD